MPGMKNLEEDTLFYRKEIRNAYMRKPSKKYDKIRHQFQEKMTH